MLRRAFDLYRLWSVGTEIKTGLKAGEIVVTDGQLRLNGGTKVTVKNTEPAKATP